MMERKLQRPIDGSPEGSQNAPSAFESVELAHLNIELANVRHNNWTEKAKLIHRLLTPWLWRIGLLLLCLFKVVPAATLFGLLLPTKSIIARWIPVVLRELQTTTFSESCENNDSKHLQIQQKK